MDKVKEIAKGKAKSMFTTSNPGELIMELEMMHLPLMEKKGPHWLERGQLIINSMPL